MEWCLDCHRDPERYVRPRGQMFSMDYVPPPDQITAGKRLVREYHIRDPHKLFGLSPMKQRMPNHDFIPIEVLTQGTQPELWRTPEEFEGGAQELELEEFSEEGDRAFRRPAGGDLFR